jgi:2',3'-cyclic-nucleotide 2'-phosphodiesterase (5'-nucleotidase family)
MKFCSRIFLLVAIFLLTACQKDFIVQKTETKQFIFSGDVNTINPSVDNFLKPYRDSLQKKVGRVLIVSEAELTKGRSRRDQTPAMVAMGNFMTDVCLQIGRQQAQQLNLPRPDVSIFTWGSIRKSLPAGNITVNDVYELMPFENEMFLLKLNGQQLKILFDQLASENDLIAGGKINKGQPNQIFVEDKPLNESKSYYVIASDYLALGGDNLNVLKEASERFMCKIKIRDGLIQYLEALNANGQILKPNYEQRIR